MMKKNLSIEEMAHIIKRGISPYYIGEGEKVNLINIKNIQNGVVNMAQVERIKIKSTNLTQNLRLEVGDLVLAIKGFNYKCGLVDKNSEGSYINSNLIAIKLKPNCNPKLVLEYLNSSLGQRELNIRASGSIQKSLSVKSILDIKIPIFTKDEENKLIKFLDANNKLIKLNTKELELRGKLNNEMIAEVLKK